MGILSLKLGKLCKFHGILYLFISFFVFEVFALTNDNDDVNCVDDDESNGNQKVDALYDKHGV